MKRSHVILLALVALVVVALAGAQTTCTESELGRAFDDTAHLETHQDALKDMAWKMNYLESTSTVTTNVTVHSSTTWTSHTTTTRTFTTTLRSTVTTSTTTSVTSTVRSTSVESYTSLTTETIESTTWLSDKTSTTVTQTSTSTILSPTVTIPLTIVTDTGVTVHSPTTYQTSTTYVGTTVTTTSTYFTTVTTYRSTITVTSTVSTAIRPARAIGNAFYGAILAIPSLYGIEWLLKTKNSGRAVVVPSNGPNKKPDDDTLEELPN